MFKNKIFILAIFIVVASLGLFFYDFFSRTLQYKNHIRHCANKSTFCGIQVIKLGLQEKYINKLIKISEMYGKRIEIPKKHQKNISSSIILQQMPEIENFYSMCIPIVSGVIGEKVEILDKSVETRMTLVVYEKEGDYIDWHFDTNHYDGRFFTLLIPVTFEPTCGNYQYKNENGEDNDLEIFKGEAILFEGDKVFHRGKMLCKDQHRVILSFTFVTNTQMNLWNYAMIKMKTLGVYGK